MITLEALCIALPQVTPTEIKRWIDNQWLCPEGKSGHYFFREIDQARVQLIIELRDDLGLTEEAIPFILQILDQLYTTRRQMRCLCEVITTENYPDLREKLRYMLNETRLPD